MTDHRVLNEGAGKPRRVTVAIDVDTSAFRAALDELRRSVGTVGEAFAGMAPAFREVASALTALARELAHGEQVRRAAVERYGLASTDELLDELLARLGRPFHHEVSELPAVERAVAITTLRLSVPRSEREYRTVDY